MATRLPDVALESALHGGLNVRLEGIFWSSLQSAIEDAQEGDKKGAFDVRLDGSLKGAFISVIEDTLSIHLNTPKDVLQDLCKDPQEGAFRHFPYERRQVSIIPSFRHC